MALDLLPFNLKDNPIIESGRYYILDKDFNNASKVYVCWVGAHYVTVRDIDGDEWDVMKSRLSELEGFVK